VARLRAQCGRRRGRGRVTVEVRVSPDQIDLLTDSLSAQAVEEVLDGIGALLTSRFQRSWRLQRSPSGDAWGPRLTPNVAGIVKDLNAGGFPKGRRFQPRPAVVDTGRLRGSLTWEVRGSELVVGSRTRAGPSRSRSTPPGGGSWLSGCGRIGLAESLGWAGSFQNRRLL